MCIVLALCFGPHVDNHNDGAAPAHAGLPQQPQPVCGRLHDQGHAKGFCKETKRNGMFVNRVNRLRRAILKDKCLRPNLKTQRRSSELHQRESQNLTCGMCHRLLLAQARLVRLRPSKSLTGFISTSNANLDFHQRKEREAHEGYAAKHAKKPDHDDWVPSYATARFFSWATVVSDQVVIDGPKHQTCLTSVSFSLITWVDIPGVRVPFFPSRVGQPNAKETTRE